MAIFIKVGYLGYMPTASQLLGMLAARLHPGHRVYLCAWRCARLPPARKSKSNGYSSLRYPVKPRHYIAVYRRRRGGTDSDRSCEPVLSQGYRRRHNLLLILDYLAKLFTVAIDEASIH